MTATDTNTAGSHTKPSSTPPARPASGTDKFIVDDVIGEVAEHYLDEIDPALTGMPAPAPSTIKHELLNRTNLRFEVINSGLKGHDRVTRLKLLTSSQIARILIRLHHAVTITAGGLGSNKDYDLVGIYLQRGPKYGTYTISDVEITSIARDYNQELTIAGGKEIMRVLREKAPQVTRCTDRRLTPFANGIYNYETRELMDFTPDLVFTSKMATPLLLDAECPVYYRAHDPSGNLDSRDIEASEVQSWEAKGWEVKQWDVVSWVSELSADPEVVDLLWQVIGATLRPYVRWNKTSWFYSERGNNGKGTLAELMRHIIGESACAVIPLSNFGKDFMLEPLTQAAAIIVDENDVGTYLDKVANLKAIVTNDVVSVNRKGQVPINFRFWGHMVQCLNEFPQVRDRSESFYRRQLFIPFEQHFAGGGLTYIKDEYLQRPEVHQYVAKHVMSVVDEYWQLSQPEATQRVLDRYKEANDPVREFWNEFENVYVWDLLPFSFLYDLFKAWFAKSNPSGRVVGRNKFIEGLVPIVRESSVWYCRDKSSPIRTGSKMDTPELLIQQFDLEDWKRPGYAGKDLRLVCSPVPASTYRGLERYVTPAPSASHDDDTDKP